MLLILVLVRLRSRSCLTAFSGHSISVRLVLNLAGLIVVFPKMLVSPLACPTSFCSLLTPPTRNEVFVWSTTHQFAGFQESTKVCLHLETLFLSHFEARSDLKSTGARLQVW